MCWMPDAYLHVSTIISTHLFKLEMCLVLRMH